MRKGIIYLGVIFILLSVVVLAISSFGMQNSLGQNIYGMANLTFKNQTVKNSSFASISINLNDTSVLTFFAKLSNKSNVYFMNAGAFSNWVNSSYNKSFNGIAKALALEDKGVIIIYHNVSSAVFPAGIVPGNANANSTPEFESSYAINGTLQAGRYYIIIDNTNGSASYAHSISVQYFYYPIAASPSLLKGNSSLSSLLLISSISVLLFIAGFALIIAGIVMKRKGGQTHGDNVSDEQLNELYKGVEAKHARRSRHKSNKKG